MTEEDLKELEPETSDDAQSAPTSKGRRSFKNIRRELTDDELSSPAVQRMLIDDIERLERENYNLADFQTKFHSADKNAAVLAEKLKDSVGQEVIFGVCLTVGAAAIGFAPSLWKPGDPTGCYVPPSFRPSGLKYPPVRQGLIQNIPL